ncbi:thymidine kinase 2, mitochondrial-like [Littorina saxatilis]|uniref:thymidine kinase 2, mitochondrial-like n=1 Tax=Littorina saxatilis TaxID=31220 RepID=UPI0038B65998
MLNPDIYSFANLGGLSAKPDNGAGTRTFKRVAVEGNIGCGKTTFLEHFRSNPGVEVIAEPVEKWKSVNGFNCFDLMYKDTVRWSLAFQSYVTLTMLENHEQEKRQGCVKMIERTLYSARYCFIENLNQKGLMTNMEHFVLKEWHDWIADNADTGLDLIVYLRASPETCHKRIEARNRSEESSVSLDYLNELHKLHEDWLVNKTTGVLPAPVLVIDVDEDLNEVVKKIEDLTPQILQHTQS